MRNGFSLIELMVYMGVAAVLLLLSFSGILILQQNARDSERNSVLGNMDTLLNRYKRQTFAYPLETNVSFSENQFTIVDVQENISLDGFLSSDSETSSSGTNYIYEYLGPSEYRLCVQLESGSYKGLGTASCPN